MLFLLMPDKQFVGYFENDKPLNSILIYEADRNSPAIFCFRNFMNKAYDWSDIVFYRWIFGRRPEFVDPKIVSQGEGREGRLCKFCLNIQMQKKIVWYFSFIVKGPIVSVEGMHAFMWKGKLYSWFWRKMALTLVRHQRKFCIFFTQDWLLHYAKKCFYCSGGSRISHIFY